MGGLAQAAITAGVWACFGATAAAAHLGAAAVALTYMAIFDYMMHYGGWLGGWVGPSGRAAMADLRGGPSSTAVGGFGSLWFGFLQAVTALWQSSGKAAEGCHQGDPCPSRKHATAPLFLVMHVTLGLVPPIALSW